MPWNSTKEGTLPSLKNKSIESRKVFSDVANKSLEDGRTEEESIFAGLAAVSQLERNKSKELKKSQDEQKAKDSHVPEHIRLLQEAIELKKQQKLDVEFVEENKLKEKVLKFVSSEIEVPEIEDMYFDNNGKLVIKYNGKISRTSNSVPEEVINKYISVAIPADPVVQKSLEPITTLNGSTPEIVFLSNGDIVMQQVILEE